MSDDEIQRGWLALRCACFGVGMRMAQRDDIPPYARMYIGRWLKGRQAAPPPHPRVRVGFQADESGASELCCAMVMIGGMESLSGDASSIRAIQDAVWETLAVAVKKAGLNMDEVIADADGIGAMLTGGAAREPDDPAHPMEARAVARLIRMSDAFSAEFGRRSAPMRR